MSLMVVVKGNKRDIQAEIDLALRVADTKKYSSYSNLRKVLLKGFMDEERSRISIFDEDDTPYLEDRNFSDCNDCEDLNHEEQNYKLETSETSLITENQKSETLEEISKDEKVYSGSVIAEENTVDTVDLEESSGTDWVRVNTLDLEESVYGISGVAIKDLESEKENSVDTVDSEETCYSSTGVDIDGLEEVKEYRVDLVDKDVIYVSFGVDIDDLEEVKEADEDYFDCDDLDDEDNAVGQEEFDEEEDEDYSDWSEAADCLNQVGVDDYSVAEEIEEVKAIEEDAYSVAEEIIDEAIPNLSVGNVIDEVPKDLRSFLKKYPNSEIAFVQKYFSQKDIDKQLKLGRIYKRKGKLLI